MIQRTSAAILRSRAARGKYLTKCDSSGVSSAPQGKYRAMCKPLIVHPNSPRAGVVRGDPQGTPTHVPTKFLKVRAPKLYPTPAYIGAKRD